MKNDVFLNKITESFNKYLETGSRSNAKLKILHGCIAEDIQSRLGSDYKVHSLGIGDDREVNMSGRYMNKKVDIGIEKDGNIIAGIAIKFIMRNYSQNSNNYFENMLGETANIRSSGKPYFQIVILPSKVPYFKKNGELSKIEIITKNNISKYIKLSNDNPEDFFHTPSKTLLYLINVPEIDKTVLDNNSYVEYYYNYDGFAVKDCCENFYFGKSIIYNNYELFLDKIYHFILSQ